MVLDAAGQQPGPPWTWRIPNPAGWEGHLKLLMPARAKAEKDKRHPSWP